MPLLAHMSYDVTGSPTHGMACRGSIGNRGQPPNILNWESPDPPTLELAKVLLPVRMDFLVHIPAISATNFQAHAQILTSEISIVLCTK